MDAMYERTAGDLQQIEAHFAPQPLQVGAIFVLDGVAIGLDLFDSPATWRKDRKSTRLNSSHSRASRMPSSA